MDRIVSLLLREYVPNDIIGQVLPYLKSKPAFYFPLMYRADSSYTLVRYEPEGKAWSVYENGWKDYLRQEEPQYLRINPKDLVTVGNRIYMLVKSEAPLVCFEFRGDKLKIEIPANQPDVDPEKLPNLFVLAGYLAIRDKNGIIQTYMQEKWVPVTQKPLPKYADGMIAPLLTSTGYELLAFESYSKTRKIHVHGVPSQANGFKEKVTTISERSSHISSLAIWQNYVAAISRYSPGNPMLVIGPDRVVHRFKQDTRNITDICVFRDQVYGRDSSYMYSGNIVEGEWIWTEYAKLSRKLDKMVSMG